MCRGVKVKLKGKKNQPVIFDLIWASFLPSGTIKLPHSVLAELRNYGGGFYLQRKLCNHHFVYHSLTKLPLIWQALNIQDLWLQRIAFCSSYTRFNV